MGWDRGQQAGQAGMQGALKDICPVTGYPERASDGDLKAVTRRQSHHPARRPLACHTGLDMLCVLSLPIFLTSPQERNCFYSVSVRTTSEPHMQPRTCSPVLWGGWWPHLPISSFLRLLSASGYHTQQVGAFDENARAVAAHSH